MALIVPTYISTVSSSSGSIKINTTGVSTPGQQVRAGDTVCLYMAGIIWTGDQFYLFLSQDGSNQMGSGLVYTPTISVYDMARTTAVSTYNGEYGNWTVGYNWVNGTLPASQSSGNYYIKAVDGAVGSSVAVTDTYLTITAAVYNSVLNVSPSQGAGGTPITFTGSGWPSSQSVNIYYSDPSFGWKLLTSTNANVQGQISVASEAPDLMRSIGTSDSYETYTSISYKAETASGIAYSSITNFNEYHRGLLTVGTQEPMDYTATVQT